MAGNAAEIAERKNASFGAAQNENRFSTSCVAREVVGEAQHRVHTAVERAVDVGEEPVDRLRRRRRRVLPRGRRGHRALVGVDDAERGREHLRFGGVALHPEHLQRAAEDR